jgi:hypothetical protein
MPENRSHPLFSFETPEAHARVPHCANGAKTMRRMEPSQLILIKR